MNAPPPTSRPPASVSAPETDIPKLEVLPSSVAHQFLVPVKRINDGTDVERFHTTKAYRDICTFILQLNRAVCPRVFEGQPKVHVFSLKTPRQDPEVVKGLQSLLSSVEAIITEVPPSTAPRRFGNASFRTWHQLVEQRIDDLLKQNLPEQAINYGNSSTSAENNSPSTEATQPTALTELKEYFMGGFGSPTRLDYGTGHELSFIAFLGCLWKLGAFVNATGETRRPGDVERSIVLGVIQPYLSVVRKLILTYTLEPAGSHGVWGLDDHSFMPYIFGSAQYTRPIKSDTEPMPLEGSCPGAPQPKQIVNADMVEHYRSENMYFSAIGFINDVKKGPFWEHSPTLFDISGIKDGWGKINKGMIKMFNAEVLGKFPVVQHFPFGSLFQWEKDPDAPLPGAVMSTVHTANQPVAGTGGVTTFASPGAGLAGVRGGLTQPWPSPSPSRVPMPTVAPGAGAGAGTLVVPGQMQPPSRSSASGSFEPGGPHITTKAPWAK